MFKNDPQTKLVPIFHSIGSNPLSAWDVCAKYGSVQFLQDQDTKTRVLDLSSPNVSDTLIRCPKDNGWLGVRLPFLVMVLKNMKRYFCAQVTIRDSRGMNRRYRMTNFGSKSTVNEFSAAAPICLNPGWNRLIMNLDEYTARLYGTRYVETGVVTVNANVRLRNVYFARELMEEHELPAEYRFFGASGRQVKTIVQIKKKKVKKNVESGPPNSPRLPENLT